MRLIGFYDHIFVDNEIVIKIRLVLLSSSRSRRGILIKTCQKMSHCRLTSRTVIRFSAVVLQLSKPFSLVPRSTRSAHLALWRPLLYVPPSTDRELLAGYDHQGT